MSVARDLRGSAEYLEAERLLRALRAVGSGRLCDAAELHAAADGRRVVFAGTHVAGLDGAPVTRICEADLETGATRLLTPDGAGTERSPKYSPDGRQVAFASDRGSPGDFQLWLLDAAGRLEAAPRVDGWIEYLHWSGDGRRILVATAGHGADMAGGFGAMTTAQRAGAIPDWVPRVETGSEDYLWRRLWLLDVAEGRLRRIGSPRTNVWEAAWCGPDAIVAVVSPGPGEGLWYHATLVRIDVESGEERLLHAPRDQLGWPAASPSGRRIAFVEAVASDRWIVAGELKLVDGATGAPASVDTRAVDVACTCWLDERRLAYAGQRALDSVVGICDTESGQIEELWVSRTVTSGGRYISVSFHGTDGDFVLCGEGFLRAPGIATVRAGEYRTIASFDHGYERLARGLLEARAVEWRAPDGLALDGWLLQPRGTTPRALVMEIHGGPVWQWRPRWLVRDNFHTLFLASRGYAVFWPNPRGSAGYGTEFARRVQGDLGGADTQDFLSGIDHLVAEGIADPGRLGVTGRSYGGFMASWLITQDARFAAAVPLAPSTNQVSVHLTSNIPEYSFLFLDDTYLNPTGRYFERSPIMHAHKARTPCMSVCGALDRCTPPGEALQFHNALLANGCESVLVTYPLEGHGNRQLPAVVDYAARLAAWFGRHMPPGPVA